MAFFKKTPPAEPIRRRPSASEPAGQIFSYHSQRSLRPADGGRREPEETLDLRQEATPGLSRRKLLYGRLSLIVALIVFVVLTASSLTPEVRLSGDQSLSFLQPADVYQTALRTSLSRSLFNRNKLTLDSASARLKLLQDYPEVKSVELTTPLFGSRPIATITAYQPSFILATSSGSAVVLDETGRAMANTSQVTNLAAYHLATIQDKTNLPIKLGNRALPSSTVAFTRTVVQSFAARQVRIAQLTIPANAYELDVLPAGKGYYVKFNLENDAREQAGTYLAVANRLMQDKATPTAYVDVRVPERAYYK